jgi:hypothetical protein
MMDPANWAHKRFMDHGLAKTLEFLEQTKKKLIQDFTDRLSVLIEEMRT